MAAARPRGIGADVPVAIADPHGPGWRTLLELPPPPQPAITTATAMALAEALTVGPTVRTVASTQ
jgi:hypothetical protein